MIGFGVGLKRGIGALAFGGDAPGIASADSLRAAMADAYISSPAARTEPLPPAHR
jgi:hypothetical protein